MEKIKAEVDHHLKTWQTGYKSSLDLEKQFLDERRKKATTSQRKLPEADKISLIHQQMYSKINMADEDILSQYPKEILVGCY
jgi:hypothetical protein